mgnify:CR=1 FL=1
MTNVLKYVNVSKIETKRTQTHTVVIAPTDDIVKVNVIGNG